jgi:hypothetical protein
MKSTIILRVISRDWKYWKIKLGSFLITRMRGREPKMEEMSDKVNICIVFI